MSVEARVDLERLLEEIQEASREFEIICQRKGPECSEQNFMSKIEGLFEEHAWRVLGVPKPAYEYKVYAGEGFIARHYGRIDAWYGLSFIEYKLPSPGLRSESLRSEAIEKCKSKYIPGLLNDENVKGIIARMRREGYKPLITGIIFDGRGAIFVTYDVDTGKYEITPSTGVYELNATTLRKIILRVLASYRKGLVASELARSFGYESRVAREFVRRLYEKLVKPKSERTVKLFEEWYRLISQAYPINGPEIARIAKDYGFREAELKEVDGVKLFYAIQTYYAFILKLIAAEIAAQYHDSAAKSFLEELKKVEHPDRLQDLLRSLEEGGLYAEYGIKNYLEGEFFSWYLDEWDGEIYKSVSTVIEKLSMYGFEALLGDVRNARDLFKLLYEELIPRKEVRQKLGIYATPDWLAELVLDELGLTVDNFKKSRSEGKDPLDLKVLDPGVGTGTFLTLYIQRLGEYLREAYGPELREDVAREALRKITRNVIGFDIDALAVLTARTNYLVTLAAVGLLDKKGGESIEIPVYMANSVVTAEELRDKIQVNDEYVEAVRISTTVGDFHVPVSLMRDGRILNILSDLRPYVENKTPFKATQDVLRRYSLSKAELTLLEELYNKLLKLEEKGVDRLWIPVIKSYLVPIMYKGQFDYIVGNPPWLSYRYIASPKYQEAVKSLVKDTYRLVVDEHLMTHMEMATLFFVRCTDLYLRKDGHIGFVMPKSIFSADQHHRFRKGEASIEYRILEIIDCEEVKPLFYVPTCAVIAKKGETTVWPINAVVVKGKLPEDKHKVIPLEEAMSQGFLNIKKGEKLYLNEVGVRSYLGYEKVEFQARRSDYYEKFYQGATIVPQALWFVEVTDASNPDFVVVKTSQRIERRGKIKVVIGPLPVEREFIYGVLTSAEVLPFCYLQPNIAVLPIKPTSTGYEVLRKEVAGQLGKIRLAKWLENAEKTWSRVRGEKKMDLYERLNYQKLLSKQNPNAKYKVVYLRSGTHLCACIVENVPVKIPVKINNKQHTVTLNKIIVESTLYWFETNDFSEACYLVAILNSNTIDELIKPLQSKGEFGERDIHKKPLESPIPHYNPSNPIHRRLAELGKLATEEAQQMLPALLSELGYEKKLRERGYLLPNEVGRLRQRIREQLGEIIQEIDELTRQILALGGVDSVSEVTHGSQSKETEERHNGRIKGNIGSSRDFRSASILDFLSGGKL